MPSKTFKNEQDAVAYAQRQTRCKIKSGKTISKLTEKQKESGIKPKIEQHWRVITYNRNKEMN